jgi:ribosomal protein S12 methylthiotransferase accessory factor
VGYPPEGGRVYARGDPNGIAAGNCLEEALLQALLELVERDAVALWWYNRVPRPALDLASFEDPYVHRCLAGLEAAGRSLHVLDLTHDLDIPVFAAVTLPPPGSAEEAWFGYGAHLDARIALGRALSELGQSWGLQSDYLAPEYALRVQSRSLPETDFIRPLPEAPRRPFSAFPNRSSQDFLGDLHFCVDRLQRAGLETLVVDLTCPDVGVPVVRALVPGLLHCCPRFAPGRLYDVPVALGWLERRRAEDELNPIPFNF